MKLKWSIGLVVLVLSLGSLSASALAQPGLPTIAGKIVYVKINTDDSEQIVSVSQKGMSTLEVASNECAIVSPSGNLVAVANTTDGTLMILSFPEQKEMLRRGWPTNRQRCAFAWRDDTTLRFTDTDGSLKSLNVRNNTLSEVTNQVPVSLETPFDLPQKAPAENRLLSPNGNYALYNQCLSGKFASDGSMCIGQDQVVIYDVPNQQVIQILEDTSVSILHVSEIPPRPVAASWSPSGRYLIYYTTDVNAIAPIRIYDTQTRQYVPTNLLAGWFIDPVTQGFQWSSDESHLGFWMKANMLTSDPEQFARLNLSMAALDITSNGYELNGSINWRWSPDNDSIAFVSKSRTLIIYQLDVNQEFIIDSGVYGIMTWLP